MRLDAALPPLSLAAVPEVARAAEAMGFSALWTSETQHDPFLPHPLIAEHTSRIQMGTAIAVSFARSPASLAYTAWDLAAQSGGRFILGLGTQVKGHIERRFGIEWPASVTGKLREQILAIRAFWDTWQNGARLNFRGEYYKLTLMSPFFNPGPLSRPADAEIPIYIAGVNAGLARLAGELCQGFHVHPLNSPHYLREVILPAIEAGAREAGRQRRHVAVTVGAFAATGRADRDFCRQQIAFYASTPSYRPVMELYGWGEIATQLTSLASRAAWGEMPALISDGILAEFCAMADTPAELGQALKARYAGLADRIIPYLPFMPSQQDAWWKSLITEFNN